MLLDVLLQPFPRRCPSLFSLLSSLLLFLFPLFPQFLHEVLHGKFDDILVVQIHLQPGIQSQLVRHVAEHALEESIDGGHVETAVVVQDGMKGAVAFFADFLVGHILPVRLAQDVLALLEGILVACPLPEGIEELQDAVFHLGRSLVGERYRQRMPVLTFAMHQQQGDVLQGEVECLSTARRSL